MMDYLTIFEPDVPIDRGQQLQRIKRETSYQKSRDRMSKEKRQEGFSGQSAVNIPGTLIQEFLSDTFHNQLYLSDIGYYPCAASHYRERLQGVAEWVLIFCVAGRGWFTLGHENLPITAGQYFILPPDRYHAYGANSDDPWSIYWVHFSGSGAHLIAGAEEITRGEINLLERDPRIHLFEEIIQLLHSGLSAENLSFAHFSLGYLLALFRFSRIADREHPSFSGDVCEKAIRFMQSKVQSKLTLEQVASAVQLSPSHFSALFRKRIHRAPMEYFIFLKIQRACHLLNTTNLRIKEVAAGLGFDDPYYFSRLFSKVMLTSPAAYRKQHKG